MRGHTRSQRLGRLILWAGWLGALCMNSAAGAQDFGEDETAYLKQRTFLIPIEVAADEGSGIQELRLFVSSNRGGSWTQVAKVDPSQRSFRFKAKVDGEYWFSLALVDASGQMDPPDPSMQEPGLKVVVDTASPVLQLKSMERTGDSAGVSWKILDDQPVDLSSLRIEVRDKRDAQWRELQPVAALEGEIRWPADPGQNFVVHATIEDRAGNVGSSEIEVLGTASSFLPPPSAAVNAGTPPVVGVSATGMETGFNIPPAPPLANADIRPIPKASTEDASIERFTAARPPAYVPAAPSPTTPDVVPFDQMRPDLPAEGARSTPPAQLDGNLVPASPTAARPIYEREPIASTTSTVQTTSHTVGKEPVRRSPEPPPRVPLIGTTRFAVDYALRGVGPAGVGKVELYYTKDNGAQWTLYGEDPDRSPPFEVDLPGEGRYGLAVVVTSPAGHGMKPPQSGDAPKILVEVDTTAPEAELYRPTPDPATNGETLLIGWSARDPHLPERPVGLFFAENATGPWYRIAVDLPAVGQYSWRVPPRTPHQVYLKLMVLDLCNNVAEATTAEPVLVDLSKPEAEVIGIAILPGAGLR